MSTLMLHSSRDTSFDCMPYVLVTNSSTHGAWRIVTPTSNQNFSLNINYIESNKWFSSKTYGVFLQTKKSMEILVYRNYHQLAKINIGAKYPYTCPAASSPTHSISGLLLCFSVCVAWRRRAWIFLPWTSPLVHSQAQGSASIGRWYVALRAKARRQETFFGDGMVEADAQFCGAFHVMPHLTYSSRAPPAMGC
jgi:hypothetical protein